jgi:nucleoside-diphosphate-sugar epimerase
VNVSGSRNLLEECRTSGGSNFVFTSTSSVYAATRRHATSS